jgi:hypothetical protein
MDVGKPSAGGSVTVDNVGRWTVHATNGDIGTVPKKLDNCFWISQPLVGDGSILMLLLGQEGGSSQWAKTGVMIRANNTPGAPNVFLGMTTGHGVLITYRPVANRGTLSEGADRRYGPRRFPIWLRLQREGDHFTPFSSVDGFGWTQLHSPIVLPRFPEAALAGIVTSAFFEGSTTAVLSNPLVVPSLGSPIVQASAGNGAVLLTWPPVSSAVAYRVRRGEPNAPGFAADVLTPSPMRETSFADTDRPNERPARYLVSALFEQIGQQVEGWPADIMATPVPTPGHLFGCDINLEATQLRGGIAFDPASELYKISGAGGDVGGTEDHCFYASEWVQGDFQVTARILDKGGKAGVMVRETLTGPSRMLFLAGTPANGVLFQYRPATGAAAASPGKPALPPKRFQPPLFLRLVRRGATITPFFSVDGATFTPAARPQRFNPPLPESLYFGYAITSQNPGAIASNSFSHLTIGPPPP